jgi:hypothetical protein
VFLSGLMMGRTPELLGKKIEAFEMKLAAFGVLLPAIALLLGTALACSTEPDDRALGNSGRHSFSEMLYAMTLGREQQRLARSPASTRQRPVLDHHPGRAHVAGPLRRDHPGARAWPERWPAASGVPSRPPGRLPTDGGLFIGFLLAGTVLAGRGAHPCPGPRPRPDRRAPAAG